MTKKLFLLLTLTYFISCKQKTVNKSSSNTTFIDSIILPPPPPINDTNEISFSCGYSGKKSEAIKKFTNLLNNKNYSIIIKNLNSKMSAEKYLASIICIKLLERKLIQLSPIQHNKLNQNLISSDKITICTGCTSMEELSINEMDSEKNFLKNDIKEWLNKLIPKKKKTSGITN